MESLVIADQRARWDTFRARHTTFRTEVCSLVVGNLLEPATPKVTDECSVDATGNVRLQLVTLLSKGMAEPIELWRVLRDLLSNLLLS